MVLNHAHHSWHFEVNRVYPIERDNLLNIREEDNLNRWRDDTPPLDLTKSTLLHAGPKLQRLTVGDGLGVKDLFSGSSDSFPSLLATIWMKSSRVSTISLVWKV